MSSIRPAYAAIRIRVLLWQYAKQFSIVMDLETMSIGLTAGNPCRASYESLDAMFMRAR